MMRLPGRRFFISRERRSLKLGGLALALALGVATFAATSKSDKPSAPASVSTSASPASDTRTELGINLYSLAYFNRHQAYLNLIAQSEWQSSYGQNWTMMSDTQFDKHGWVRELKPGQIAPRQLMLPPPPFRPSLVRCTYQGRGELSAGGVASVQSHGKGSVLLEVSPTGADNEMGWIELIRTDPADPVRNIDCRQTSVSPTERFHPAFLEFVKGFKVVRFLDWQRTNDNIDVSWATRTLPEDSTQIAARGASIEDMIEIANRTGADPWFLMPYKADEQYIRQFALLVREKLDPKLTVYVELGNEVWNDVFDAAEQAKREGLTLKLGNGDPTRARMVRYAQKVRAAMKIWTDVYADRPDHLVRVAATQHANPDLANIVLDDADTAKWVDALATAPYIWFDLNGFGTGDLDQIFAAMPGAIDNTMKFAEQNRDIARKHRKQYITYEGGQHLVTSDLKLAVAIQRDPRMADVYRRYLAEWDKRIRSTLTLYASTTPIAEYGSWGLMEYGGQPLEQAPKLRAVREFQDRAR
jgi:hypothetical protein